MFTIADGQVQCKQVQKLRYITFAHISFKAWAALWLHDTCLNMIVFSECEHSFQDTLHHTPLNDTYDTMIPQAQPRSYHHWLQGASATTAGAEMQETLDTEGEGGVQHNKAASSKTSMESDAVRGCCTLLNVPWFLVVAAWQYCNQSCRCEQKHSREQVSSRYTCMMATAGECSLNIHELDMHTRT